MSVIDKFKERDLFYQASAQVAPTGKIYCGFDGTAKSLQAGNLMGLSALRAAKSTGVDIVVLLGGATTVVGDPTGKNEARKMLQKDLILENLERIKNQVSRLLPGATIVNNADWLLDLSFMDFLNEISRFVSVGSLVKLEMFANRLANHDPLTVLEFMYPLMQGYDFLWLFENLNCSMQCGGSEQWCNILTGVDLIRKKHNHEALALTFSLLTTSDGRKMGKSEKGAVWIDATLFSPYDFWQYWRNVPDDLVLKCLKKLTEVPLEKIVELEHFPNEAKILLANELTTWIHGVEESAAAQTLAKNIFIEKDNNSLSCIRVKSKRLADILQELQVVDSLKKAKSLIEQDAVLIDSNKITDKTFELSSGEFIISVGKKKIFKVFVE